MFHSEASTIPAPENKCPHCVRMAYCCKPPVKDRFATAQEMLNALKKLSGEKEDVHNMAYEDDIEYDHTAGDTAGATPTPPSSF